VIEQTASTSTSDGRNRQPSYAARYATMTGPRVNVLRMKVKELIERLAADGWFQVRDVHVALDETQEAAHPSI